MSARPRLLDLFCGAGGAGMGYHRAGFDVVGVDIAPQQFYPFEFVQADAMTFPLDGFDAVHASPPCQFFTQMRASWRAQDVNDGYEDLLTPTRARLAGLSVPWVIENVIGAGKAMQPTVTLHGAMFGLRVHRPRHFESNVMLMTGKCAVTKEPIGVYDKGPRGMTHHRTRLNGNGKGRSEMRIARTLEEAQDAMGMDWADWHGTKEAIPPAYTEFIGTQLLASLAPRYLTREKQRG